jgi:hypothetical protein
MGESCGTYSWMDRCANFQWLYGHCTSYVRNLGDDFVEAFLERYSPIATKIEAQFRVQRAHYRRKHGPNFLVGEGANAVYDYVAIAPATTKLHEVM